eukprot:scaffold223214_cov34-Prasinocladus_malaysianus.AAC.1
MTSTQPGATEVSVPELHRPSGTSQGQQAVGKPYRPPADAEDDNELLQMALGGARGLIKAGDGDTAMEGTQVDEVRGNADIC